MCRGHNLVHAGFCTVCLAETRIFIEIYFQKNQKPNLFRLERKRVYDPKQETGLLVEKCYALVK